ncbi:hypothetical protein [Deinococcus aluminii]|uniref:Helix-turn-helix domain-containing protein n=1 Tax=Deinococcus aluminii TaxID=1656885 RepID=A0ABP9XIM2_9DEIO
MTTKTMSVLEAAELLSVHPNTIYRLIEQRRADRFPESLLKPFGDLSAEERLARFGVQPENFARFASRMERGSITRCGLHGT